MSEKNNTRVEKGLDGQRYLVVKLNERGETKISESELLNYLPEIYGNGERNPGEIKRKDLSDLISGKREPPRRILLTRRQKDVIDYIQRYLNDNGISPTYDEIANKLRICKVSAYGHVTKLVKKGAVTRRAKYKSRSIDLLVRR